MEGALAKELRMHLLLQAFCIQENKAAQLGQQQSSQMGHNSEAHGSSSGPWNGSCLILHDTGEENHQAMLGDAI